MLAWNLSLLSANERMEGMARLLEATMPEIADHELASREEISAPFGEVIAALISRKLQLYPLDRRWLLGVQVVDTAHGYRVIVQSELDMAA